jgi:hypothetical protein
MRREQTERKKFPRKRMLLEILPLDPRDPAIMHAKDLIEHQTPRRRGTA